MADAMSMDEWFGEQKFNKIIHIAGNHDFLIENAGNRNGVFKNATYIEDETIEWNGLKIYGSPWVPNLLYWAFHKSNQALMYTWDSIPEGLDILITHGPPYSVMDESPGSPHYGCLSLFNRVKIVEPKIHCFGHVHSGTGIEKIEDTTFINASVVNERYQVTKSATEIEL